MKETKPMSEKTAVTDENKKMTVLQHDENKSEMAALHPAENNVNTVTLQSVEKDSIADKTITLLTNRYGNLTLTRYQTPLSDGTLLQWAKMTEPNQPDFRMFKCGDTWYFPATECRGYFGLYESPIPAQKHVRKENRVLLPAIDRGGWVQKLWLVDLEGLMILAKDAKADRRAVFVKRLATVILPLIGGDLRIKDGYYHQLKKENGEIIDRNHRLRAQNTQYQDTIAHQIKTIDRLKDQLKRDDKLFGKQKETIVKQGNSLQEKEAKLTEQTARIGQLETIKETMNARYAKLNETYANLKANYDVLNERYQAVARYAPIIESLQKSFQQVEGINTDTTDGTAPARSDSFPTHIGTDISSEVCPF